MSWIQAILLGLLQGATEFLPVSSSGHLVLVPWLFGWPTPSLIFDVMVHWATAFAIVGYFWRDWLLLLQGIWRALRTRSLAEPQIRLVGLIIVGTVPAALLGWLLEDFFEGMFARPAVAAGFLLVTAGIMTVAERWASAHRDSQVDSPAAEDQTVASKLSWLDALLVGLAQAAAIFPGISRSGSTITAAIGRGLKREAAARFSFLLATPIILGAGIFKLFDLTSTGELAAQAVVLVFGFIAALAAGLACIHFLLRYLQRRSLYPFAIYCACFGLTCLIIVLFR